MRRKKNLLFVCIMLFALLLVGCGKYSDDMTTVKLNENIKNISDSGQSNTVIKITMDGNNIASSFNAILKTRWLLIDGKFVLELPCKDDFYLRLPSGNHTIQIVDDKKMFGKKSNICAFHTGDNRQYLIYADVMIEKNKTISLVIDADSYYYENRD